MLIKKTYDIKCPSCGKIFERELWNIVDKRVSPEVVGEILTGEFNNVECSSCKTKFHCEVPFLYQDLERKLVVTVLPEAMRKGGDMIKQKLIQAQKESGLSDDINRQIFFGINTFVRFLEQVEKESEEI